MPSVRRVLPGIFALLLLFTNSCSTADDPSPSPSQDRPVVDLAFTLPEGLATMTGTEKVTFTPQAKVCELVFRAWPNKPATASSGNSLTVENVTTAGTALPLTVEAAGAPQGSPGTLVRAALPQCSDAGTAITADLTFDVTLGAHTDERIGYSPQAQLAWLGSAYPLLAWDGEDWARDPAVDVTGESATSQAFQLRSLAVTAPSRYQVAGMGDEPTPAAAGSTPGTTVHTFRADGVRDVSVTVGALAMTSVQVGRTKITLALPTSGVEGSAAQWNDNLSRLLRRLEERLGTVPFRHLWISVIPDATDGVEFPGAVQFGDVDPDGNRWLIAHELAHMWFYGLVGNNQARDPWLDEALASYAQELVEPTGLGTAAPSFDGRVGNAMTRWSAAGDPDEDYVETVYRDGTRMLLQARTACGAEKFDAAVRDYLSDHAYGIATPDDFAAALRDCPASLQVLREAGAVD